MISIIVACDPFGVIGDKGKIPWRVPEDLKLFRKITLGNTVIMGRVTWESLPKRILDGRVNIVISRIKQIKPFDHIAGPHFFTSLQDAFNAMDDWGGQRSEYLEEKFIVGGEQIYKLALDENIVDKIIMSVVDTAHKGDRFFPKLSDEWSVINKEPHNGFTVFTYMKNRVK